MENFNLSLDFTSIKQTVKAKLLRNGGNLGHWYGEQDQDKSPNFLQSQEERERKRCT